MRVSFVIPCYQEEDALAALRPLLGGIDAEEIVFVDDGSTDATAATLAEIAAGDARVKIETHAANRGVGAAMRTGIAATRGEVVVVYDADRTYPLRHLLDEPDPRAALETEILRILAEKPEEHHLEQGNYGNLASFMQIGG